ncbi:MAG: hypothetical protein VX642_11355 [Bdellovibrionota bacterium]|nr:hypothetical protein [Bdellovibrionota bacterium]
MLVFFGTMKELEETKINSMAKNLFDLLKALRLNYFCLIFTLPFLTNVGLANDSHCPKSASTKSALHTQKSHIRSEQISVEQGLILLSEAYQKLQKNSKKGELKIHQQFYSDLRKFYELYEDHFTSFTGLIGEILKVSETGKKIKKYDKEEQRRLETIKNIRDRFYKKAKYLDVEGKIVWQSKDKKWKISLENEFGLHFKRYRIQYLDYAPYFSHISLDPKKIREWNSFLLYEDGENLYVFSQRDFNKINRRRELLEFTETSISFLQDDSIYIWQVSNKNTSSTVKVQHAFNISDSKSIKKIAENRTLVYVTKNYEDGGKFVHFYEFSSEFGLSLNLNWNWIFPLSSESNALLTVDNLVEIFRTNSEHYQHEIFSPERINTNSFIYEVDENNLLVRFRPASDTEEPALDWYQRDSSGKLVKKKNIPYFSSIGKVAGLLIGKNAKQNHHLIELGESENITDLNIASRFHQIDSYLVFSGRQNLEVYRVNKEKTNLELIGKFEPIDSVRTHKITSIEDRYIVNYSNPRQLEFIDLKTEGNPTHLLPTPDNMRVGQFKPVANSANSLFLSYSLEVHPKNFLLVTDLTGNTIRFHLVETDILINTQFKEYFNEHEAVLVEEGIQIGPEILIQMERYSSMFKD